jgi:hypothetical protein
MCGSHLTAAEPQRAAVALATGLAEKYCGHCGREFAECGGTHLPKTAER